MLDVFMKKSTSGTAGAEVLGVSRPALSNLLNQDADLSRTRVRTARWEAEESAGRQAHLFTGTFRRNSSSEQFYLLEARLRDVRATSR